MQQFVSELATNMNYHSKKRNIDATLQEKYSQQVYIIVATNEKTLETAANILEKVMQHSRVTRTA